MTLAKRAPIRLALQIGLFYRRAASSLMQGTKFRNGGIANFLLFVKNETSKFSEKLAPIFPAEDGVAQKRKEFLRLLLKLFCKTCYTKP